MPFDEVGVECCVPLGRRAGADDLLRFREVAADRRACVVVGGDPLGQQVEGGTELTGCDRGDVVVVVLQRGEGVSICSVARLNVSETFRVAALYE